VERCLGIPLPPAELARRDLAKFGRTKCTFLCTGQSTGQKSFVRWLLSGEGVLSGVRDRETLSTGQSRVERTGHARCHAVLSGG
jgi:hypothetical protein